MALIEFKCGTVAKLATIRQSESGLSTLELRLVTCFESKPKLDLRTWYRKKAEPTGIEYAGKGVRLSDDEARTLYAALHDYLNK